MERIVLQFTRHLGECQYHKKWRGQRKVVWGNRKKNWLWGSGIYSDQDSTSKRVKLTKEMWQIFLTYQVSLQSLIKKSCTKVRWQPHKILGLRTVTIATKSKAPPRLLQKVTHCKELLIASQPPSHLLISILMGILRSWQIPISDINFDVILL